MEHEDRPFIAITMGDPSGVGPEIVAKSLGSNATHAICRPIVVGNEAIMRRTAGLSAAQIPVRSCNITSPGDYDNGITVYDPWQSDLSDMSIGTISEAAGEAAAQAVIEATRLAMEGVVEAIVTAPINKAAINAAG